MFVEIKNKIFSYFYYNLQKIRTEHLRRNLDKNLAQLKKYGEQNDLDISTSLRYPERIELGSYIYIGPGAYINGLGGLCIEDGTIVGPNLVVHTANHNYKNAKYIPYDETFEFRKVKIGENVWIGGNVIILPGSVIGEGSIVGAGSVVSGVFPSFSIIGGNPAKIIKSRDNKDQYLKLKQENLIYLKMKKENNFEADIYSNYKENMN